MQTAYHVEHKIHFILHFVKILKIDFKYIYKKQEKFQQKYGSCTVSFQPDTPTKLISLE